jgi:hypothetical protein
MNTWYYRGYIGQVISELEMMKMVIERILSIVDDEVSSAHKRFRIQSEKIPDEGLDSDREELWVSQDLIPRHIINSLFISIFSLFEDEMVKICELLGNKAKGEEAFKDYKNGISISKCKRYLKEMFAVSVEDYTSWQEIPSIKDLRNMISHNNGRLENRDQRASERLKNYIDASEILSLDEFTLIVIDRQYLFHVENVFRVFLKDLLSDLEARQLLKPT